MEMYQQLESVETARAAVTVGGQGEREPVRKAPLGRLLVDAGLATRDEVQRAAEEAARNDERFGEVLLRHGSVEERDLARLLAEQWDVPFIESPIVAPSARGLLSLAEARTVEALPLSFESGRALVAVTDPSAERFGQVRSLLGRIAVDFVVVTPTELERRLSETGEVRPARGFTETISEDRDGAPELELVIIELATAKASLRATGATLERAGDALRVAVQQGANLQVAEQKLAERERDLAAAVAAKEQETARASELEAEVARRHDFVKALGSRLRELTMSVETAQGMTSAS